MLNKNDRAKHIVLFKGKVPELQSKIDRFIKFLKVNDIEYYIASVEDEQSYCSREFDEFVSKPDCVMFSYNNVGTNFLVNQNENLWKKLNIPVYTYLVDPPSTFYEEFSAPNCDINVICCDKDHMEFVQRFYPKITGSFFIPQGGEEVNSSIPISKRPIDVIYLGSQTDFHGFPVISFFDDGGIDLYSFCVNYIFEDNLSTAHHAIDLYLQGKNIILSDSEIYELMHRPADEITNYVRHEYKSLGMHALDDLGVHVDIYGGNSWVDSERPFSENITIHDRIPNKDVLQKAGESKISLCFIPWFKRGCSEKNFDSMLNGALCVSDRSEYLNEHYQDGFNIVYFDLNNPAQMAADIKWLLDNPDKLEILAKRGYETAKRYDSNEVMYSKIYNLMNT